MSPLLTCQKCWHVHAAGDACVVAATGNDFPRLGINTAELVAHVEALIEEAATEKPEAAPRRDLGAVNWADIGVRDVEYRLSMFDVDSKPLCVVLVEEAEPYGRFAQWLNERIDRARFPSTYVECEW